jgi:dTMP kinase
MIVCIDGLDGCGKSTQLELLSERLNTLGVNHKLVSFPCYDEPTSVFVTKYLDGEFSKTADGVNSYTASSFYALDRYASYTLDWGKDYREGTLILSGRYISSNLIHQMVKSPREDWDKFSDWLYDFECNKLGLPNADLTVFLDMPIEISQKLLSSRYHGDNLKKDIHEKDVQYLKSCRESALYSAERFGWKVIPCSDGENPLPIESISNEIFKVVESLIC